MVNIGKKTRRKKKFRKTCKKGGRYRCRETCQRN